MKHYNYQYLENQKVSIPMHGTKLTILSSRMLFQMKKLCIEILIKKMKPLVMKDKGRWGWMSRKIFDKRFFFGIFGPSGLQYNEQNQQFLISILLYKFYVSDCVHDGGNRTLSGWRLKVQKLSELKKVALLRNFPQPRQWCNEHKLTILPSKSFLKLECFRCRPWSNRYRL